MRDIAGIGAWRSQHIIFKSLNHMHKIVGRFVGKFTGKYPPTARVVV